MRSERGGLARELVVGLVFTCLVWGVFIGSATFLARNGHVSTGRLVGASPFLLLGLANAWLAFRPGDVHEARPWARCGSAIRALAFWIPSVWFVGGPPGFDPLVAGGIFLVGMVASFAVPMLVDSSA